MNTICIYLFWNLHEQTSDVYNFTINEAGNPTDKFYAIRDLLKNYLNEGETLSNPPALIPKVTIPKFELTETANLFFKTFQKPSTQKRFNRQNRSPLKRKFN